MIMSTPPPPPPPPPGIAGLYGLAGTDNSSGDHVKKLDILSNEIMISALTVSKTTTNKSISTHQGRGIFFTGRIRPGREGCSNAHGSCRAGSGGVFERSRVGRSARTLTGRVGPGREGCSNAYGSRGAESGGVFKRPRVVLCRVVPGPGRQEVERSWVVSGRVGRGVQSLTGRVGRDVQTLTGRVGLG